MMSIWANDRQRNY